MWIPTDCPTVQFIVDVLLNFLDATVGEVPFNQPVSFARYIPLHLFGTVVKTLLLPVKLIGKVRADAQNAAVLVPARFGAVPLAVDKELFYFELSVGIAFYVQAVGPVLFVHSTKAKSEALLKAKVSMHFALFSLHITKQTTK